MRKTLGILLVILGWILAIFTVVMWSQNPQIHIHRPTDSLGVGGFVLVTLVATWLALRRK